MVQKQGIKSVSVAQEMRVNDASIPILFCHLRGYSEFSKKLIHSNMMFLKMALSIRRTITKVTHMFFSSGDVVLVAADPERTIT